MKTKVFCMMVLCTGLIVGCDKETEKPEIPKKPPVERPEEPEEPGKPVIPPSTDNIIKTKIGDINMIVGSYDWNAIAFGNGKYVVVGRKGYSTTSTDVLNWSEPQTIGESMAHFNDICFKNGKFVACAAYGRLAESSDGINWNVKQILGTSDWKAIAYGNGKFVALSYNGYVTTSTDGINWTEPIPSGISGYGKMVYGNGKFVAIADTKIGYSANGDAFTISLQNSYNWKAIAYGNGKFVALSYNGYVTTSTDGISWSDIQSISSMKFSSATYERGKFVALCYTGTVNNELVNYYIISEDGINWSAPEQIKDESGNTVTATLNGVCAMP